MQENEIIDDAEADAGLILPETLDDTKAAISELIGEVTQRRTWVKLQYEGRKDGLRVDWDRVREEQEAIAELQGDIDALKKHASGLREKDNLLIQSIARDKEAIKAANIEKQAVMQREAMALKNDKKVAVAQLQARKADAALQAVKEYIKEHCPDHLHAVRAVSDAAKNAVK